MKNGDLPDHIYQNLSDISESIYDFILSFEDDGEDSKIIANAAIQACVSYLAFMVVLETKEEIDILCEQAGKSFGNNVKTIALSLRNKIDSLNTP